MSHSDLSKPRDLLNESAQSFPITHGNPNHAIDMELVNKETVPPESLSKVKNKDCVCIDVIEDNKELDTKEEDPGIFAKIPELKVHIISPATAIRKSTVKEFYDSMVEFREQQRLAREIRHQKQSSPLPLQTVMLHDDLNKSSETVQAPGYPPVPKSQDTRNPRKEDQEYLERLRGGFDDGRSTFVAVVLTITFVMLAFTVLFVAFVVMVADLKSLFKSYSMILCIFTGIVLLTVNCTFAYSECARRMPVNFLLLFITMLAMSVLAAATSSRFNTDLILLAVLATTIVVGICCIIASMGFDFTSFLIYLIVISLALSVVCLVFFVIRLATGEKMKMFHLFLLLIMTGVQCIFLIVQLQMILGGKSIELSEEDYALGAYFLYTSIINIFLNLLSLLGQIDLD